jgi:hypothetical protein
MHLPHNTNEKFARLRILSLSTTTNIFLFSPVFRLEYGLMVTGACADLPYIMKRRQHFYGVDDVFMIVSKASLIDRTEEICMD